jgi:hypothetical protein
MPSSRWPKNEYLDEQVPIFVFPTGEFSDAGVRNSFADAAL